MVLSPICSRWIAIDAAKNEGDDAALAASIEAVRHGISNPSISHCS